MSFSLALPSTWNQFTDTAFCPSLTNPQELTKSQEVSHEDKSDRSGRGSDGRCDGNCCTLHGGSPLVGLPRLWVARPRLRRWACGRRVHRRHVRTPLCVPLRLWLRTVCVLWLLRRTVRLVCHHLHLCRSGLHRVLRASLCRAGLFVRRRGMGRVRLGALRLLSATPHRTIANRST